VDFESMIGPRPLLRTNTCGAITIEIDEAGELRLTPFLPAAHAPVVSRRPVVAGLPASRASPP
jgi:hypothetical protein